MYLKSIEIRGFKSFADKTELLFEDGVTAIVGPNGSGKSNISDAVRWVLGEQSVKSLRGGKMEDVIFAGTQFRKPVGLCQVSLTLDNEDKKLPLDYADVTISRRLYRSGESEYYINNTQCRLKDIQELFMDTGIGKAGYSIIGQGKIEAVLSGKPEERRSLLEEAAGIVKFKWRKEEAEKKLENTEVNLIRIDDILGAYNERLEPLGVENEKAKKFIKLSEELRKKEIGVAIYSIKGVEEKIKNLQNYMGELTSSNGELNNKLTNLKEKLQSLNKELEDTNARNSNLKKEYYENKAKKQDIEAETKLWGERLENLNSLINKNSNELSETTSKLDTAVISSENKSRELNILKISQGELDKEIKESENIIRVSITSISDKNNLIRKLKDDQIEYLSSISNIKNSILILNNDIETLKQKVESIKNSCESYTNSIKINSSTKYALLDQIDALKLKIDNFEEKTKANKGKINKMSNTLSSKEREWKEVNSLNNKLEANHNMLINLDKQYEGYNRAVKTLMADVLKGKVLIDKESCFILGEIIHVDRRIETAIEVALGGAISDIITKNEDIAKNLIKYLKVNNIGRATFLPLTIVKAKKVAKESGIVKIKGYIGIASELITYDKIFTNAIEHILGRTVICQDMDNALAIAKFSNYSFKIVTLSGEVVNPGGSLTGGSLHNKNTNIIGRKREIEELKLQIHKNEQSISRLNTEIQEYITDIKKLDEENLNFKDQIHFKNIEITEIKGKINVIDNESKKLKENLIVSNREIEILNGKIKDSLLESSEKQKGLDDLILKQIENDNLIIEFENKLKDKNKEIEDIREKLTQFKVKKAQIDENVLNKNSILQKLDLEINELKVKKLNIELENNKSIQGINKCNIQIVVNTQNVEGIEKYILQVEEKIKDQGVEIIKIKEKINIHNENIESLNLIITKKEEELHKLELSLSKFAIERDSLITKLTEELEIAYDEAEKYEVDVENFDAYNKEISTLKKYISSLGVVNLGAIEEFKELTDKVNFISTQRQDLIQAKEELNSVINEMIEKMKIVFNENFNILRKNFNETFNELFKGGSADLLLTDGNELTGNIDITVQPPGKKLQNINLMSGGEKGLSAIALLFAILKMKPTPFCILDEIEAALDDANVFRYAEFLKQFSENIQFIVITHRKGTMEVSDALYGVTMEEKGISKIVSVDLSREAS